MGCNFSKKEDKDLVALYSKYAVEQSSEVNAGNGFFTVVEQW